MVRSDGARGGDKNITVSSATTQDLTEAWSLGAPLTGGWVGILFNGDTQPRHGTPFNLTCAAPAPAPKAATAPAPKTVVPAPTTTSPYLISQKTTRFPDNDESCPKTYTFLYSFQFPAAGTYTYHMARSDGARGADQSITVMGATTQEITQSWSLGAAQTNAWVGIQFNGDSEPRYSSQFSLTCASAAAGQTPVVKSIFAVPVPVKYDIADIGDLTMKDNISLSGGAINSGDIVKTPQECLKLCQTNDKCGAYMFVRPGVVDPNARCWLKSLGTFTEYSDSTCIAGIKRTSVSGVASAINQITGLNTPAVAYRISDSGDLTMKENVKLSGYDINSGDAVQTPQECQSACQANTKCWAYTFEKPGVRNSSARCWLKSTSKILESSDSTCISGIKRTAAVSAALFNADLLSASTMLPSAAAHSNAASIPNSDAKNDPKNDYAGANTQASNFAAPYNKKDPGFAAQTIDTTNTGYGAKPIGSQSFVAGDSSASVSSANSVALANPVVTQRVTQRGGQAAQAPVAAAIVATPSQSDQRTSLQSCFRDAMQSLLESLANDFKLAQDRSGVCQQEAFFQACAGSCVPAVQPAYPFSTSYHGFDFYSNNDVTIGCSKSVCGADSINVVVKDCIYAMALAEYAVVLRPTKSKVRAIGAGCLQDAGLPADDPTGTSLIADELGRAPDRLPRNFPEARAFAADPAKRILYYGQ